MAPTPSEIKAANKVVLETTDENVILASQAKIEDAYNVNQGLIGSNTWWSVKFPK